MEINERITVVETTLDAHGVRFDRIESRLTEQEKLVASVAVIANNVEALTKNMASMQSDIKTLMSRSGKMWDSVVEKLIWLAVGGVITYCFSTIMG